MSYSALIAECAAHLGFVGANADYIEAWIRVEHGTLDALSRAQFEREVATAIEFVRATTSDENDALAASFGLIPRG